MPSPHIKTILQHHFPLEIIIRILLFLKLNDVISIRYNLHKWNHVTHVLETHDNELEGLNCFLHSLPNVIALFTNLNQLTLSHLLKELNFLCYKGRLHYNTSRLEKLYISVPLQDQNLSADLNDTADNPTWGLDKFQLPVLRQLVINNGKNLTVFLDGKCWSFLPNLTYLAVYNDRKMLS